MRYDPAPPYAADIRRDPDYRQCGTCGTWYCPLGGGTAPYVCMDCKTERASK